jgi:parvulin-like peptidyl-prolyl isomerase
LLASATGVAAQHIVEDDGVGMTLQELEYIVAQWPQQMQQSAANDVGDRLELISKALATKKMAREFDAMKPSGNTDAYWEGRYRVRDTKRSFMLQQFLLNLEIPDMNDLAQERYTTDKDKYALVPEQRISSHILFACSAQECETEGKGLLAESVLAELKAGAVFEDLARSHSDDRGTREAGGRFEKWISEDEAGVAKNFVKGLYSIEQARETTLVKTEFGYHIIRLDEVKEAHHLPFKDVKQKIVTELESAYKKQSLISYVNGYQISENVVIDGKAMEKIFRQYQDQPTEVKEKKKGKKKESKKDESEPE